MKILVTGGAGFIASNIVDAYIAAGHQVVVMDDLSSGKRENLNPQARFVEMDICSPQVAELMEEVAPEIINHHAAQIDVRKSVSDPIFDAKVNIQGALNLLEAAVKAGTRRFIFSSSGGCIYGEPETLPVAENCPMLPLSPYGITKMCLEHYLRFYRDIHGLDHVVLRYGNVFGPRQDPHGEAGVVAIFSLAMLNGKTPTIFGDGTQERDYVFVEDVVRANLLALEAPGGHSINIGTGRGTSVNQLYAVLQKLTGFTPQAQRGPARPGELARIALECSLARRVLGWQPQVSLEEGLSRTVEHFRGKIAG